MPKTPQYLQRAIIELSHCNRKATFPDAVHDQTVGYWHFNFSSSSTTARPQQLRHRALQPTTYISPCKLRFTHYIKSDLYKSGTRNMSSDADYASFLDKANQDTGSAEAKDASKKSYGTKGVNTTVPTVLEQVEEYYVSDADEPFEPVALKYDGSSVSADDLKNLIGRDKNIEEVKQKGFESQYKKVVDAVKQAGNGEVHVFRVELSETRAEYYVVSVDDKGGKIVGLKALSVES